MNESQPSGSREQKDRSNPEKQESVESADFLPEERAEEYMSRFRGILLREPHNSFEALLENGFSEQRHIKNEDRVSAALRKLETLPSIKKKFSEEKRLRVLDQIRRSLGEQWAEGRYDEEDGLPFKHTNTSRSFFAPPLRSRGLPLNDYLFCIGSESQAVKAYLHKVLSGKTLYLLGGGSSAADVIEGNKFDLKQIVNIDPYLGSESIERALEPYISLNHRAEETEAISEELKELGIQKADEIWASFSVPYYSQTPEQIKGVFETIKTSLAENGIARIVPLKLQFEFDNPEIVYQLKETFLKEIEDLTNSEEFNVYIAKGFNWTTLYIEKLPRPKYGEVSESTKTG